MMTYYLKKETVQDLLDSGEMFTDKVTPEKCPSLSDVIVWEMPDDYAASLFRADVLTPPRVCEPWSDPERNILTRFIHNGTGITKAALLLARTEHEIFEAMFHSFGEHNISQPNSKESAN